MLFSILYYSAHVSSIIIEKICKILKEFILCSFVAAGFHRAVLDQIVIKRHEKFKFIGEKLRKHGREQIATECLRTYDTHAAAIVPGIQQLTHVLFGWE